MVVMTTTALLELLLILIVSSVPECTSNKPTVIDEFIEASNKRRTVESLSCHVCHSETHTSCYNLTEDDFGVFGYPKECEKNSSYCMVRKFSFTVTDENQTWPMKTFGIKRTCSTKCEPGCVIMGERTRLYVCNSCCQGDNCNIGSGADRKSFQASKSLVFSILIWFRNMQQQ